MSAFYYIVLIALALIGGFILFSKMSSSGKKLGDEETDKTDQMAKEDKELISEQVQEVLGGTLESYVNYHYWEN